MKNLLLVLLFIIGLFYQATGQVYNRPLSEAQTFYIPSDAVNNDVVGTVLAYPEFHNIGSAPTFALKSNVDNIYSVSSSGVITVSNNSALGTGDDVITVTISKPGFTSYDINVTITSISVASNTFFIDPTSGTNGTGTRANPKNAIPDLNSNSGYKYWFKRGTTLTVNSQMAAMGNQTNKYFCSYGQGAKAKIVGNKIRIFSAGSGCSNLRFSELEVTAASPAGDGSNWLTQPFYFIDSNGGMEVSHCTISYGLTGIGTGVGTALPGYALLFNTVHNTEYDGLYINKITNYTNIIGNYVYSVNWAYQFVGTTESQSGGDCIQFSACDQIIARGNYCDHSQFGNKFCIIAEDGSNNRYTAQITDNYCLAPPNNTAIYVQGYVTGTKVSRNYTQGGVQGISYGGGGGIIQIDYNVVKTPSSVGIYGGTSNIYNNTLYGCATGISSHTAGYPAKNNLFYFTSSSQVAYSNAGNAAYDYNLFSDAHTNMFGSGRSTVAGQTGEDNSLVGNPSFISATDYHLNSNSPSINAGINVGLVKDKESVSILGRPDIGAYESGSSTPTAELPVIQNAAVENATPSLLELTYSLSLSGSMVPAVSSYAVVVNGVARTVTAIVISGTKAQLTLSSAIKYGDIITASYTKPATNPLQTTSGGIAASFASRTVTNNLATPIKALPVTITMTVSQRHVYKTVSVTLKYSSVLTAEQAAAITPEILRIIDTTGKIFVEKLLVTGTTSIKFPVNLKVGVYSLVLYGNGVVATTQNLIIY